jgi:hypothetical protein
LISSIRFMDPRFRGDDGMLRQRFQTMLRHVLQHRLPSG